MGGVKGCGNGSFDFQRLLSYGRAAAFTPFTAGVDYAR